MKIELPLPAKNLHSNARPHWAAKAKSVRKARGDARLVGIFEKKTQRWKTAKRARIDVLFLLPRKNDDDNLWAWVKAYRDGLQDAGIIENDSGFECGTLEQRSGRKATGGVYGVFFTITRKD